jgi:hypothetical protein
LYEKKTTTVKRLPTITSTMKSAKSISSRISHGAFQQRASKGSEEASTTAYLPGVANVDNMRNPLPAILFLMRKGAMNRRDYPNSF